MLLYYMPIVMASVVFAIAAGSILGVMGGSTAIVTDLMKNFSGVSSTAPPKIDSDLER